MPPPSPGIPAPMYVKASQAAGPRVALRVAPYVFPRPRYPIVMLCPAVSTY